MADNGSPIKRRLRRWNFKMVGEYSAEQADRLPSHVRTIVSGRNRPWYKGRNVLAGPGTP